MERIIKSKRKFVFSKFLTSTISFGVLHTSLICSVIIPFFKDSGMLPLQISIIITSKRFLRLFCDTFFGLIFDRFGAKVVFLLGRILKLISYFVLLLYPTFYGFVFAMLLDGASYSSIYGKISSYIYNNLSSRRKLRLFPQAMSIYYLCMDITIAMMSFFAGVLLKFYGYNIIIYLSILTNILSIFILMKYIPSGKNGDLKSFKSKSFIDIFKTLKVVIKTKKQFIYLIMLYGVVSFLAWQFNSIASLILLDMNYTSVQLAMCGSLLKVIMGLGALLSIFIFTYGIQLIKVAIILFVILIYGLLSSFIYNPILFYIFCALVSFFYIIMEVSIEKNFEYFSDKKIRGTAISLAMTFCSIIAIISNLFIGFMANYFSYKLGLILLLCILSFIIIFILFKINITNKK